MTCQGLCLGPAYRPSLFRSLFPWLFFFLFFLLAHILLKERREHVTCHTASSTEVGKYIVAAAPPVGHVTRVPGPVLGASAWPQLFSRISFSFRCVRLLAACVYTVLVYCRVTTITHQPQICECKLQAPHRSIFSERATLAVVNCCSITSTCRCSKSIATRCAACSRSCSAFLTARSE